MGEKRVVEDNAHEVTASGEKFRVVFYVLIVGEKVR